MQADDAEPFLARLIILGELFDAKLSEARQTLYFDALADLPLETVLEALARAARERIFMPKPVEIRELAQGGSDEDLAERAWLLFRRAMAQVGSYCSLVVDDAAMAETIVAMFRTWPEACGQELSPEMWTAKRKEFGRVYRVYRMRPLMGPRLLVGVCELANAALADWVKYVPVARVSTTGILALDTATARVALSDTLRAGLAGEPGEAMSSLDQLAKRTLTELGP